MVYVVFFSSDGIRLLRMLNLCQIEFNHVESFLGFRFLVSTTPIGIPTLQIPYLEIPQNWAGEIMFFAAGMDLGCRSILAAQSGHVRSGGFRAMPRVWSAVRMAPGIPIVSRVPVQPVK